MTVYRHKGGTETVLLCADIGNSSIGVGVYDGAGTGNVKKCMTSKMAAVRTKSADEYAVTLDGILRLRGISPSEIDGCMLSSVVPPLTAAVSSAVKTLTGVTPMEVGPGIRTGLNIRVDSQTQLGADLVANAVAASALRKPPFLIVDVGCATTLTVVDAAGVLEGVIICPGVRMSLDALASYTAALPDVPIVPPKRLIAKNSADAMNAGVLLGHAFMIDGFIDRIGRELGCEGLRVIVTGGLADTVIPFCRHPVERQPDLTLDGLALLYQKNRK